MADSGQDEEVIRRLQQHHAQVLRWSRQHIAAAEQDLRLKPSGARVQSRGGPKLAGSILVAGVVLVTVALLATSFVPGRIAGPGATPSLPPTGASSPVATEAGSRLSISGDGDTFCQSEGGCAAFFRIQGGNESPQPELRFGITVTGLTTPADAPRSIVPGRYTISAHLNWVSDVIFNGQSPQVGGVDGSCTRDVVIEPSVASVAVRITFHGLNPCEIAVETSVSAPSSTVAVSPTSGPVRSPGATMIASGFTTAGVAGAWSRFGWTSAGTPLSGIGQVLQWSGGYVATASPLHSASADPSPGLWTSTDGQTWTAARGISDDAVRVSVAPVGLVAIGFDGNAADGWSLGSAWSSSDGRNWTKLGRPDFPGSLVSIAGTSSGIVATVAISHGTGKGVYGSFQIEFSTDGLHWTAENVSPGLASAQDGYGEPPHVQTNAGRFYLMGSAGPATSSTGMRLLSSASPPDEMWLSGDGKTWTKSAGGYSASGGLDADYIDFGRDGMILHTNAYGAAPGATGLAYSHDGGRTWHEDANYSPLGPTTCQGACGSGEDGVIGANGTYFVAVKNGGKKAWLSYDGQHWSSIAWTGGDPFGAWYGGNGFLVMPLGVLLANSYGAAS